MGSLRNPVGSLPSAVYWRRRVLVLAALLVVLALILYACSGSGSGKKKPAADGRSTSPAASQTSSVPASGASSSQAASGGPTTASGGPSGSGPASSGGAPSGSAGASGGPGGATGGANAGGTGGTGGASSTGSCQLSLTLSTQSPAYANGDKPAFTVTAVNKGTAQCNVDLGPKSLILNIFTGSDRVWSSADCTDAGQDLRGIAPGAVQTVTYTWNRLRSAAGCPADGQTAKLGTYFGVVSLAAGSTPASPAAQSQPKIFELKSGS